TSSALGCTARLLPFHEARARSAVLQSEQQTEAVLSGGAAESSGKPPEPSLKNGRPTKMNDSKNTQRRLTGSAETNLGLVLIAVGGLLLLSNLGIIGSIGGITGLLMFGGLGAWLLAGYYSGRRRNSGTLIAGFILLGIAAATVTGSLGGAWFLALSGFGFLSVWRENAKQWWAVIPGGVLLTLAGTVLTELSVSWLAPEIVFFAGLALTFLALSALPRNAQQWALIPAAISAGIALLLWGASGSWLFPVLLIGTGLYLMRGQSRGSSGSGSGG